MGACSPTRRSRPRPDPLPYASRPEIRTALGGGRAQGERHSDTLGEDLLYTAVPVTNNGRVVGAARVTQSIEAVHDRVRRGVLALVGIGGFALLVGLGVAWLLANSLSKPLRSLAGTARRVEAGDLEARAEETGPTRTARGGGGLQRHDRPARDGARRAA